MDLPDLANLSSADLLLTKEGEDQDRFGNARANSIVKRERKWRKDRKKGRRWDISTLAQSFLTTNVISGPSDRYGCPPFTHGKLMWSEVMKGL